MKVTYTRKSEKNKELNSLEWTKLMNNYKNTAEKNCLKWICFYINIFKKEEKFIKII